MMARIEDDEQVPKFKKKMVRERPGGGSSVV